VITHHRHVPTSACVLPDALSKKNIEHPKKFGLPGAYTTTDTAVCDMAPDASASPPFAMSHVPLMTGNWFVLLNLSENMRIALHYIFEGSTIESLSSEPLRTSCFTEASFEARPNVSSIAFSSSTAPSSPSVSESLSSGSKKYLKFLQHVRIVKIHRITNLKIEIISMEKSK
jgi:hypothetical protein